MLSLGIKQLLVYFYFYSLLKEQKKNISTMIIKMKKQIHNMNTDINKTVKYSLINIKNKNNFKVFKSVELIANKVNKY